MFLIWCLSRFGEQRPLDGNTFDFFQGFGPRCGSAPLDRGVSPSDQQSIVAAHNELRSKVAQGQETRGRPGPQPPAADMMEMSWDNELAQSKILKDFTLILGFIVGHGSLVKMPK